MGILKTARLTLEPLTQRHHDGLRKVDSIKVMERLGMRYVGIETHYEQQCATYRLDRVA
jgi:hypothetical protein